MEENASKSSLVGFTYYLSEKNFLEKQIGLEALKKSKLEKTSYIEYLHKNKLLDSTLLAKATSEYFGLPLCDLKAFNKELIPTQYLSMQLVRKRLVLPLFTKGRFLFLATTDPAIENLEDIRFLTGHDLRLLIVEMAQLKDLIDMLLNKLIISEISGLKDVGDLVAVNKSKEKTDLDNYDAESAPVVNYVNKIIMDAIDKGASDIHFERYENEYRIRYRLHGVLYPIATPPLELATYLLARIKIMASLDITEHRLPQDGRFKMALSKHKSIDFRVSICPTLYGEKIVLRLLDPTQIFHTLDQLGMEPFQTAFLIDALEHTQGIILVTGPTGSGKSVTLYSALNHLNSADDNIMTVEDPVEIPLFGINQVQVNPKVGLSFSSALRSFLRQDPDIIMIGEIRDLETAEIAVRAAQTGHLVLSTLHTNSSPETIGRLINMGVESFNLASSIILVIAQRLLRVLCQSCRKKENLPDDVLLKEGFKKEELGALQLYKADGCERCSHGYVGRTGIFEVMPITKDMAFLIMRGANSIEIAALAEKEGVVNLRETGLAKVKLGITSLAELNRIFR